MKAVVEPRLFHSNERSLASPPLAVDLDGTLVRSDLLVESLLALLKEKPVFVAEAQTGRSEKYPMGIALAEGKIRDFHRRFQTGTGCEASHHFALPARSREVPVFTQVWVR
jgi:hypothetical protein